MWNKIKRSGWFGAVFALFSLAAVVSIAVRPEAANTGLVVAAAGLAGLVLLLLIERIRPAAGPTGTDSALAAAADAVPGPLVVLDGGMRVVAANDAYYSAFRVGPVETVGRVFYALAGGAWDVPEVRRLLGVALTGGSPTGDPEVTHHIPGLGRRSMSVNARRVTGVAGERVLLALEDVTERRAAEAVLAERARLTALRADVGAACSSAGPMRDVLRLCCEALVRHLGVDYARAWTLDEAQGVLELQAGAGSFPRIDGPHARLKVGEYKVGRIAAERRPGLTNDAANDPELSDRDRTEREGIVAFAGCPLMFEGRCLGVLAVFSRRPVPETLLDDLSPMAAAVAVYLDRVRVEGVLRAGENREALVRRASGVGFWYCDLPFDELQWDEQVKAHFHLAPDARVTIATFYDRIHPDDREPTRRAIERSIADHTSYDVDYRTVHPATGETFWVRAIGRTSYDDAGNPVRFDGVTVDVTARKQAEELLRASEERYRLVGQAANDAIWDWDLGTNLVVWNEGVRDNFGFRPDEVGPDAAWWIDHLHPDDRDRIADGIDAVIDGDSEFWQDEYRFRRADGDYATVFDRGRVVRDGGRPVRMIGSMLDLTERRKMEDELRRLAADLSAADRRKDEFLATLAHELRNPLAPIRNGLDLLKLAAADPGVVERVRGMMERQVGQMVHLIDDLMDVSRINRGKIELRKARVEAAAVVRIAVETSTPLIRAKGHTLTVDVPAEPLSLDADTTRLTQVLTNLLNNAAKYTPRGGRISLVLDRDGDAARFRVRDDGVGIPEGMLSRVFDLFTQVDRGPDYEQGGLGIGLSLVKGIVEMHGGTVGATSGGPGSGSEFVVRLPFAADGPRVPATPAGEPGRTAAPRPRRVLIADDNRDSADSLSCLLTALGNETRTAYDGREAVEAAEAFRPDVILLDIGMPAMNGYEACRRIRERAWGRAVFIAACTGWGQEEDRRRSKEAGFDLHLVKPVDPAELRDVLAKVGVAG